MQFPADNTLDAFKNENLRAQDAFEEMFAFSTWTHLKIHTSGEQEPGWIILSDAAS